MTTDSFSIQYYTRATTYQLNGFDSTTGLTFNYLGDQGFGLAPLHRITTRGPMQHGDSDIDFRLDPRVLQVPLLVQNSSTTPRYNSYAIRQSILNIFRPQDTDSRLHLVVTNGTLTVARRIKVRVLGGLSFDVDPQDYHVRTVVQLRADDPTWYSRDDETFTYTTIGTPQTIANDGNFFAFPVIRINGPITNPTITNNTTGQSIAMTATIGAGAWFEIDLSYGKKTVVDNLGANRISTVSATSNLATWSLVPGNNSFTMTGTGTTVATNALFTYNHRYTGI